MIGEVLTGLPPYGDRAVRFACSCADGSTPMARVDRARMAQVITNLVVNAEHHGSGDVEVRCVDDDNGVRIDVLDDGAGVAPEHVGELFMPFARFSDRSDSTGLGLAICRAIVEAHGGSIEYGREPEGRTRFSVWVPVAGPTEQRIREGIAHA